MRGYPKHLNTPADLELVRQRWPEKAAAQVQAMMGSSKTWQPKKVKDGEKLVGSATLKKITSEDGKDEWLELVDDPEIKLKRLGVSKAEAAEIAEDVLPRTSGRGRSNGHDRIY